MKSIIQFKHFINIKVLIVIILVSGQIAPAQENNKAKEMIPLENLLLPNGSLNTSTGFCGSLDPRGWKMQADKYGKPYFVRTPDTITKKTDINYKSNLDNIYWDDNFGYYGIAGDVFSMAACNGDLFIGGNFQSVGNLRVNQIIKWCNNSYDTLNSELKGHLISAIAVQGTNIYVGGMIYEPDGINGIARWDGSGWFSLGEGIGDGIITTIAVDGNDVYIGGSFQTAGNIIVNNIAKWDGSNWYSLGNGVDGTVEAIAVSGSDVFVGGYFINAGNTTVNHIAKWDGNNWSTVGIGTNAPVRAIVVDGNNVYAGGEFTNAGGTKAYSIAKWDGNSWLSVGDGGLLHEDQGAIVTSMAVDGSDLYVGGLFTTAGNVTANNIAKWDGIGWSALGTGTSNIIYSLQIIDDVLYAGGTFDIAGNVVANNIAKWDGNNWSALENKGNGINSYVKSIAANENYVYVGGNFIKAGNVFANNIAKWDGNGWSSMGYGVNGEVFTIAVNQSDVYVGGSFNKAGNVDANNIAKWDGNSWSALGSGTNSFVSTIKLKGNDVYVGGAFTIAGDKNATNIAKWDGNTWIPMGVGESEEGCVYDIAIEGDDIYIGGILSITDSDTLEYLAKWNENHWSAIPIDLTADYWYDRPNIQSIALKDNDVYIGGIFNVINGENTYGVAKWDGVNWSTLGSSDRMITKTPIILSIKFSGEDLYIGGYLTLEDSSEWGSMGIAKWDGFNWTGLGNGISGGEYPPSVGAIETRDDNIYIGGNFTFAGGKPSYYFGRWSTSITATENDIRQNRKGFTLGQNYPNPANTTTTIQFTIDKRDQVSLKVYDLTGREVKELINREMNAGTYEVLFDVSNLTDGMYLYSIKVGKHIKTKKMILIK